MAATPDLNPTRTDAATGETAVPSAGSAAPTTAEGGFAAKVLVLAGGPPADDTTGTPRAADTLSLPTAPPGFVLERELGRGGMGVVYLARQVGLNRLVALKLVPAAARSNAVIRFLAEAEAVAAVRHPNVIEVYQFGESAGHPFLVLEYCPGGDLAAKTRAGYVPPREAAELMAAVADGVAAAHAAGVVHRDLKPHNVLVAADGTPKVTDFGLAKQGLGSDLTPSEAVMGTPAYMSPEQAGGGAKFVGPETDVWALGVMLYELLAGWRPFPGPSRMDFVVQVLGGKYPPLRAACPAAPRDLELIVDKCLRREPRERYASAGELADDLRAWLAGRSVSARPMGAAETAVKWAKRNKPLAASLALAAAALLAGTAVSLWQAAEASEQTRQARAAEAVATRKTLDEHDARLAETAAKEREKERADSEVAAKRQAQEERAVAVAVRDFLQSRLLRPIDPWERINRDAAAGDRPRSGQEALTVRELLDAAAAEFSPETIGDRFPNQPVVQAEVLETVGATYDGLKENAKAARFLQAALAVRERHHGRLHPATLTVLVDLLFAQQADGRHLEVARLFVDLLGRAEELVSSLPAGAAANELPPALRTFDAVLERVEYRLDPRRFLLPPISVGVADAPLLLLQVGQALVRVDALAKVCVARFGAASRRSILARLLVGFCRHAMRDVEAALEVYEGVYADAQTLVPADHWVLSGLRQVLNTAYSGLKIHPEKQVEFRRQVFESYERTLGDRHPATLLALAASASDDAKARKYTRAVERLERAHDGLAWQLGPDHTQTLDVFTTLADTYTDAGLHAKALAAHRRLYPAAVRKLGPTHDGTLTRLNNLAVALQDAGHLAEAIERFEQLRPLTIRHRGADHRQTLLNLRNLAGAYWDAGRLPDAVALMEATLASYRRKHGRAHEATLLALRDMLRETGDHRRLVRLAEDDHRDLAEKVGPRHPDTLHALKRLAEEYSASGAAAKAAACYETLLAAEGLPPKVTRDALVADAIRAGESGGLHAKVEAWRRELLARAKPADGDLSDRYANELLNLGDHLARRGKWADAEPLFRECVATRERLVAAKQVSPWLLANARSRLGEAQLRLGHAADAEPLLVDSYRTLQAERDTIPDDRRRLRLAEAADRVIALYESTDRADDARRVRAERAELRETCPSPRPAESLPPLPARLVEWRSDGGKFERLKWGNWLENDRHFFRQVAVTGGYIELHDRTRKLTVRLFADHLEELPAGATEYRMTRQGQWADRELAPAPRRAD